MAETWFLVAFLMLPRSEGQLSMSSTLLGVSNSYANEANCHNAASHLDKRLLEQADDKNGKVAMMCVKGWLYEKKP